MLAKIAATVDIVSGGRLDFSIGAGSRPSLPMARREYDANGLPFPRRRTVGHRRAHHQVGLTRNWPPGQAGQFRHHGSVAKRRMYF
jgi:alkanesulfonate monooxygenase SsuD/methylene tetrahydromethanopterin reductase-like flavin-dependent oxidoreductase (luciferase family)